MADYGIKVAADGASANSTSIEDLLLSQQYSFSKIDTRNDVSFQNIILTFNNDPPEPSGAFPDVYKQTLVHSVPHEYDYEPQYWAVWNTLATGGTYTAAYLIDSSPDYIKSNGAFDGANLFVRADEENINFYVNKFYDNFGGTPNNLVGTVLAIKLFVFVDEM